MLLCLNVLAVCVMSACMSHKSQRVIWAARQNHIPPSTHCALHLDPPHCCFPRFSHRRPARPQLTSFSQNLVAVLNDPRLPRDPELFTRDWGDAFVPLYSSGPRDGRSKRGGASEVFTCMLLPRFIRAPFLLYMLAGFLLSANVCTQDAYETDSTMIGGVNNTSS